MTLPSTSTLVLTRLADFQPKPVPWLWPGRVPAGNLTLLIGDPGLGKSILALDLAARVSRGAPLPSLDGEHVAAPVRDADECEFRENAPTCAGSVVLLSAEDHVSGTIRPRLVAAGADLARIVALAPLGIQDGAAGEARQESFSLAKDLDVLEQLVMSLARCRLVVIDPITAYLGVGNSHNNEVMRSLLAPLSDLAAHTGVAVLAINHLNKADQGPAIYRSMGSVALAATARSVLAVVADPYDDERRVLVPVKSNLGAPVDGMRYRIASAAAGDATGQRSCVAVVKWETTAVRMTADELFAAARVSVSGPAIAEAAEWLKMVLRDGPKPAVELKQLAKLDGIHERTLLRAKQRLGITARREGFGPGGIWTWHLPCDQTRAALNL
jgi:putative DNA primase/helicase